MANLNELLQDYVNKSYDELLAFGKIALSNLLDPLQSIFGTQQEVAQVVVIIISACIGVDGKISALENKFVGDLLDNPGDYSSMIAQLSCEKSRQLTDQLFDSLTGDTKTHLLLFCLSFLAVDETISRDEVAFIKRLLD